MQESTVTTSSRVTVFQERAASLAPTGALSGIKSVKEIDATRSAQPLQDDDPVAVPAVKKLV